MGSEESFTKVDAMRRLCLLLLLVVLCSPADSGVRYKVIDLGVSSDLWSTATDVSNRGQVVGFYNPPTQGSAQHAFIWDNGVLTDLPPLPGKPYSGWPSINDVGQVTGGSWTDSSDHRAVLWQSGDVLDLSQYGIVMARDINNSGKLAGECRLGGNSHACLWSASGLVDLGVVPGYTISDAQDVNERDQAVGLFYGGLSNRAHAFVWQDGSMAGLPEPEGADESQAYGINYQGEIAGYYRSGASLRYHATCWVGGGLYELGSVSGGAEESFAVSVNDDGQVVGYARSALQGDWWECGVLWEDGVARKLDSLIPADSGWQIDYARSISETGWIAGSGWYNGSHRAVVLVPVPEPPCIAALAAGLLGLAACKRGRRRRV